MTHELFNKHTHTHLNTMTFIRKYTFLSFYSCEMCVDLLYRSWKTKTTTQTPRHINTHSHPSTIFTTSPLKEFFLHFFFRSFSLCLCPSLCLCDGCQAEVCFEQQIFVCVFRVCYSRRLTYAFNRQRALHDNHSDPPAILHREFWWHLRLVVVLAWCV